MQHALPHSGIDAACVSALWNPGVMLRTLLGTRRCATETRAQILARIFHVTGEREAACS